MYQLLSQASNGKPPPTDYSKLPNLEKDRHTHTHTDRHTDKHTHTRAHYRAEVTTKFTLGLHMTVRIPQNPVLTIEAPNAKLESMAPCCLFGASRVPPTKNCSPIQAANMEGFCGPLYCGLYCGNIRTTYVRTPAVLP